MAKAITRKIPAIMATQHPDNACATYWSGKKFISTQDEIEECFRMFKDLKISEYMWDWEGKFVDEAVVDKMFRLHQDYFKKKPLGKEKFLTFRIPNIWEEKGYRLARAFMNILTAEDLAMEHGFHAPPIFEVILPMTKKAEQLIEVQTMFQKVEKLRSTIFGSNSKKGNKMIRVIPLFESVEDLLSCDKVLEKYLALYKKEFGGKPDYMRPFIARSDPALNAGIVPAVLSAKVALTHFYNVGEKHGVKMFPIIGTGSLPFRGGVNPENIKKTINEYAGIRTLTVQPAFNYDYPKADVRKALDYIKKSLPMLKPRILTKEEIAKVEQINNIFLKYYKETIEKLAPLINEISKYIPSRRERMLHVGLFGYSRGDDKIRLPRAINFNAVFYTLGIPPEFIGTGRGLREAQKLGLSDTIKDLYISMTEDLTHAGKYLNHENLEMLAKKYPAFVDVQEDVFLTEKFLETQLGPFKPRHFLHRNLTSNIYYKMNLKEDFSDDLEEAARIRKSLG